MSHSHETQPQMADNYLYMYLFNLRPNIVQILKLKHTFKSQKQWVIRVIKQTKNTIVMLSRVRV